MEEFYKYYDLENFYFPEIRVNFHSNGFLTPSDFFMILIWKSNRSKSRYVKTLRAHSKNKDLNQIIKDLTNKIFKARSDQEKFRILFESYKFRLATTSAILAVLYPDSFPVYDYRICETLTQYQKLANIEKFENLWPKYLEYRSSVKNFPCKYDSLRDIDKFLWGKSFYTSVQDFIKTLSK